MILDIDHIGFYTDNFQKDLDFLQSINYKKFFSESNLKNLNITQDFLTKYSDLKNFALLKSQTGIGIEIITYDHANFEDGYMLPMFENIQNYEKLQNNKNISNIKNHIMFSNNQTISEFRFNKIKIKTFDLKNSEKFWKSLGFFNTENDSKTILQFNSILTNKNYFIHLENIKSKKKYKLDDIGFNCLAFICNDVETESRRIAQQGFYVTNIEKFMVNGKNLKIFFSRGPSNEIVEFISVC